MPRLSIRHRKPLSENIRAAQAKAGLTNEALAREVGVGLRLLQKWRAGDVDPRYDNLLKLSKALGVSVADLWSDADHESKAAA
jgi:transcriptional regulator with XRE-family HTH domain